MKTVARRRGGKADDERKEVGEIEGEHKRATGGRAPRKNGGSAGSWPYSGARHGTKPSGRHTMSETGS